MLTNQPVIEYRDFSERVDTSAAGLTVHSVKDTSGPRIIRVPEYSVFLTESPATTFDIWDGRPYPPIRREPGMVMFLPANSTLESMPASNPYSETMIRVPERNLRTAARGELDLDSFEMQFIQAPSDRVYGITQAFANIVRAKDPPPLLVEAMTMSLAVSMICAIDPEKTRALYESKNGLTYAKLRRVQEYIEQNLAKPITLAELASLSHMSAFHFLRSFKSAMGITPVRYLLKRRVEKAQRLLKSTDIHVGAIGLACGFGTQSHFTRAFRSVTGQTPAAWRKG